MKFVNMAADLGFFKWLSVKLGRWMQSVGRRLEAHGDDSVALRVLLEQARAQDNPSAFGDYLS